MSYGLVSFGDYTFPATLQEFNANFGNSVPTTVRLPGKDGGWSMDGGMPPPTEIGSVSVSFTLISDTRAGMDALIDALMAIVNYGLAKLIYQPTDATDDERFCYAYTNYAYISRRPADHTDLWQDVRIIFQVPDPRWLSGDYGGVRIGDPGLEIDSPAAWDIGEGGYLVAASGTSTSATLTYHGNADTIAVVAIEPGTGDSCTNPIIERLNGTLVVDRVQWTGTVNAGESLVIDGWKQAVTLDAVSSWDNVEYLHPDLLRLSPGVTGIRITFANAGDEANVTFYYHDAYR